MEVFHGHASFEEDGLCKVNEIKIKAKHVLIATGGHPIMPDLPGEIFFKNQHYSICQEIGYGFNMIIQTSFF